MNHGYSVRRAQRLLRLSRRRMPGCPGGILRADVLRADPRASAELAGVIRAAAGRNAAIAGWLRRTLPALEERRRLGVMP